MAKFSSKNLLLNDQSDCRWRAWDQRTFSPRNIDASQLYESPPIEISQYDMGAMQIYWAGLDASDAQIQIQGSLDAIHWCDLLGSPFEFESLECNKLFDITSWGYDWVRFTYNPVSVTTGIVNALATLKSRK